MTRVDFYTRAADKLQTTRSLCAKAVTHGNRVRVLTPESATTERLGKMLWSVPSTGFLPHVRARHRLAPVTPVVVDHDPEPIDRNEVLINLCPGIPADPGRFQRVLEIVSTDEEDVRAARVRFRAYRDLGYEIVTHDLGKAPADT